MRSTRGLSTIVLLCMVACGGSSSTSPNNNGSNNSAGPLSATINGKAWSSQFPTASYHGSILAVAGLDNGLTASVTLALTVAAPGTFSVSSGNNVFGNGGYSTPVGGWATALPGGTGTVTVTTLTSNHVAGTFAFDAVPATTGATGTVHITNGKFDITF